MHWKDLRASGESEQKLYMLDAWREWDGYTPRERAALEWAEAVTLLTKDFVPDDVYQAAREQFNERELSFRTSAGSYQPPKTAAAKT
jgi:alkylhydroperoxidase family enzyme